MLFLKRIFFQFLIENKNFFISGIICGALCNLCFYLGFQKGLHHLQPKASSKFDIAIEMILNNEGGYVNNPNDRGGATKFGISKSSYPQLDIERLTKEDAIKIYRKDFWDKFRLDRIKDQDILNKVFDMCVLMGKARATLLFESTLIKLGFNIPKDGILDDEMIKIINNYNSGTLLAKYREELKRFVDRIVETNPSQKVFYKGWLNRIYQ